LKLLESNNIKYKTYSYSESLPNEVKALADTFIEKEILQNLTVLGIPILSEESGHLLKENNQDYLFIVDPLDGTVNYVRGVGPCGVSIALWKKNKPLFGVVYDLIEKKLIWGGGKYGSYCNDKVISVSNISDKKKALICSGFPVRFDMKSSELMNDFLKTVSSYSKIRMLGSASMSLVSVAMGKSDAYSEKNIMLWDVAAGLAIVEGAGGKYILKDSPIKWSFNVEASNGSL
jgi:myo-inositol-1(or 4)-monophosphatase